LFYKRLEPILDKQGLTKQPDVALENALQKNKY
jgi:hypothetical protein